MKPLEGSIQILGFNPNCRGQGAINYGIFWRVKNKEKQITMLFKQGNPGSYAAIDEFNRFFLNRLCLIPEDGKVPGHTCLGLNRIKDYDGFFMTHDIISYAKTNALNPQTIPFADIWYQIHYEGEKEHVMQTTHRYRDADVSKYAHFIPKLFKTFLKSILRLVCAFR